ncbi:MAG TPA: TetR/AcrR family transcriptional regulator [Candidatus Corynebacterium avicola]|uniref:TetR/AcrR family transcriptional regulator n=1 Tax=Candidatus Corynebacterium avicola TaxID=2838527 RepID=A0A9D1RNX4_9CORY|nr:TetR/AcrR family transcriptional regulator [Candidatus Corynebacterium avicola]
MARNTERRRALADAGLSILADEGARGLTHRAVDRKAGVPTGTATNYFRTRDALIAALVDRIGERLSPTEEDLSRRRGQDPGPELFADYMRDIVRRLTNDRDATIALFELRLEAMRRPEVAGVLNQWRVEGFAGDVRFNTEAGLPGGAREIALFHYAIEGLVLDQLTGPLLPDTPTDDIIDDLVDGLLGTVRERNNL